ncbi:8228_t:CDS:2, partial [Rhizophagus irregularis]
DRLVAGKRYHFLFLQSQFVNKPIKHLKYNKKSYLPNPQDYKFRVPFFSFSSSTRGRIICNVVENTSTIDDSATGSLSTVPETDTNLESSATSSFLTVNNFDPLPSTVTIPISTRAVAATQRTNSPSEGHLTAAPLVVMIKVHNYGETYPEAAPHPRYNLLSSRKKIENIPNFRVI